MEGIGQVFCKGGISEVEGLTGHFKDWGIHCALKPCLEHSSEYAVTTVLKMTFKCLSLSAPPYLTSLQPQSTHYSFLSLRLN